MFTILVLFGACSRSISIPGDGGGRRDAACSAAAQCSWRVPGQGAAWWRIAGLDPVSSPAFVVGRWSAHTAERTHGCLDAERGGADGGATRRDEARVLGLPEAMRSAELKKIKDEKAAEEAGRLNGFLDRVRCACSAVCKLFVTCYSVRVCTLFY